MKLIITLAILMACCTSFAQQKNLSKMKENVRNSYLIKLAREVSDNFGPGWIQGNILTSVSQIQEFDGDGDTSASIKKHIGRKYYKVTFIYDETTKKEVGWWYASCVRIWEDSGEPIDVMFGNDYGRHFFNLSYKTWVRVGIDSDDKMPFEEMRVPEWMKEDASKQH